MQLGNAMHNYAMEQQRAHSVESCLPDAGEAWWKLVLAAGER